MSIHISNSSLSISLTSLLYQYGIIASFDLYTPGFINIFPKFNRNRPDYYRIKVISRPGHKVYWSLRDLSLNYSRNSFSSFYIIPLPKVY